MTLRWSGLDSNFGFLTRKAWVSRLRRLSAGLAQSNDRFRYGQPSFAGSCTNGKVAPSAAVVPAPRRHEGSGKLPLHARRPIVYAPVRALIVPPG
jgi:hypothetical protein